MKEKLRETINQGVFTGLLCEFQFGRERVSLPVHSVYRTGWVSFDNLDFEDREPRYADTIDREIKEVLPHLFSLYHLTKPMKIEGYNDGKEFVPINELKHYYGWSELWDLTRKSGWVIEFNVRSIPLACLDKLIKWHFNVFDLAPEDYIDASQSGVYNPK